MDTTRGRIEELRQKKQALIEGAGADKYQKLFHDKGMLAPRERIAKLVDPGTFFEIDLFATHHYQEFGMDKRVIPADGVITGFGEINGRKIAVFSQDFAALGGSFGEMHGRKICALMDSAAEVGAPLIGINHSGGLRLHETLGPMEMYGQMFKRNVIYSGVVPQISIVLGIVAGGQAYSPGLTDFIMMTKDSSIYIAGPAFVKAQTGADITDQELGGAPMHARESGIVDVLRDTEEEIFEDARWLIDFLPRHCKDTVPHRPNDDDPNRCAEELNQVIPDSSRKAFDMHDVILPIVDNGEFFEMKPYHAMNMITGLARLEGHTVGIVANQPDHLGGVIDIKAAEKAARFVRFCDAFNIPIVSFQDSPAYLIGQEMERQAIIAKGAKLLYAYAEATVPKITVILRKAYAGAFIALGSQYIGADLVYAWPTAEMAGVASKTAAGIIFRKEIAAATDDAEINKLYDDYYEKYVKPYRAASLRHVNDIIEPRETRPVLIKSLRIVRGKNQIRPEKKHGNIPL